MFFFHYGLILQKFINKYYEKRIMLLFLGVISILVCSIIVFKTRNNPLMYLNKYDNPIIFVCSSLIGSTGILLMSVSLRKSDILESFGKRSLITMGGSIHYIFAYSMDSR